MSLPAHTHTHAHTQEHMHTHTYIHTRQTNDTDETARMRSMICALVIQICNMWVFLRQGS